MAREYLVKDGIPIIAEDGDVNIFDLNRVHYSENTKYLSIRIAIITEVEAMRWYALDADYSAPVPFFNESNMWSKIVVTIIMLLSRRFYFSQFKNLSPVKMVPRFLRGLSKVASKFDSN